VKEPIGKPDVLGRSVKHKNGFRIDAINKKICRPSILILNVKNSPPPQKTFVFGINGWEKESQNIFG
jgi:hypothetical protein